MIARIFVVLFVIISSTSLAQTFGFSPPSVTVYQGGQAVGVQVLGAGTIVEKVTAPKQLAVRWGTNIFGGVVIEIVAPRTAPLGQYSIKVSGKYNKKAISNTLKVNVLRPNSAPVVNEFAVSSDDIIQGETVTFSISVSDPDRDALTCQLDVDGDKKFDYFFKPCTTLQQKHSFKNFGNFRPLLVVSDAFTGQTTVSIPRPQGRDEFILRVEKQGLTHVLNTLKDTQDILPGDGKCADLEQLCSLRAAVMELNASEGAGRIQVPSGVYQLTLITPENNDDDTAQKGDLDIQRRIQITGEGAEASIIDGMGKIRLFQMMRESRLSVINLTLTNGRADCTHGGGGAISNYGGYLVVENSFFKSNESACGVGGAIVSTSAVIRKSNFQGNKARQSGGAVDASGILIEDCVFLENEAGQEGGGINLNNAIVNRVVVTKNKSQTRGGGAAVGDSKVQSSLFSENNAQYGGGIFLRGNSRVNTSVMDSNQAESGGGVFQQSYGVRDIILNSHVLNNKAREYGGGIFSSQSLQLAFSNVIQNTAKFAGGLYINSNVNRNDAIKATIIALNTAENAPDCMGKFNSIGYNLVQNPSECLFNAAHRDKAGVVTDKVGEKIELKTIENPFFGNLLFPVPTSKIVNNIPNSECSLADGTPVQQDLFGIPRRVDSGCDIGAIETR
jgi:hypothetical protein